MNLHCKTVLKFTFPMLWERTILSRPLRIHRSRRIHFHNLQDAPLIIKPYHHQRKYKTVIWMPKWPKFSFKMRQIIDRWTFIQSVSILMRNVKGLLLPLKSSQHVIPLVAMRTSNIFKNNILMVKTFSSWVHELTATDLSDYKK